MANTFTQNTAPRAAGLIGDSPPRLVLNDGGQVGVAKQFTWLSKPLASAYIGTAFISDIGIRGSHWRSDGTTWAPVGGRVVLGTGSGLSVSANSTTKESLVSITIPAGLIGANGHLEVTHFWSFTNSANTKTFTVELGGTAFFNVAHTANAIFLPPPTCIWNNNSETSQIAFAATNGNSTVATSTAATTASLDTTLSQVLTITGTKATGTETITLAGYTVELVRA